MASPRVSTPGRSRIMAPSPKVKSQLRNSPMKLSSQRPASYGSKIRVIARIRPFLQQELELSPQACIQADSAGSEGHKLTVEEPRNRINDSYTVDCAYAESDDTAKIFRAEVQPIVPLLFCGCDATIFACGASGSGKTHTMEGNTGSPGMTQMALQDVFSQAANKPSSCVEMSYFEVYADRCYDLLNLSNELPVYEHPQGRIQLRGLKQERIKCFEDFSSLFRKASQERKADQFGCQTASSRSHSMLTITITDETIASSRLVGRLNLIDLAGSRDNQKDGLTDHQFVVLSDVINAVNANERRVPYRKSKLTRILQDAIGGASCALMVACLSPGSFSEACEMLSLANRPRLGKEPSTPKVVSETKLRDSNVKTIIKSPLKFNSPLQTRLFKSPSRLPSHQRPSAKRVILSSPSDSSRASNPNNLDPNIYAIVEDLPSLERDTCSSTTDPAESSNTNELSETSEVSAQVENETDISHIAAGVLNTPRPAKTHETPPDDIHTPLPTVETSTSPSKSPPLSSMLRALGGSLREALTPLPTGNAVDSTSRGTAPSCNLMSGWTAVEKSSQQLRDTLLRDYLNILNTGTREDLLAMKGIGTKRAESILKLRACEEAPFLEIRDLEKIGLSAKQAKKLVHSNLVTKLSDF